MSIFDMLYKIWINKSNRIVKSRYVFTSFDGHYSDNPKYLSIKLHELYPSYEIIWCVHEKYKHLLPEYVTYAEYGSKLSTYYFATAEVIVDNVYGGHAFYVFGKKEINRLKASFLRWGFYKRDQKIYTTWHGTPLKRMGRDQIGNDNSDIKCCNIKMVLGNEFTSRIMRHLTYNKIPTTVLGTPRNDLLFKKDYSKIKDMLGLPKDKNIILFAPTFRNDGKDVSGKNINRSGIDQLKAIDFDKLAKSLHEKFGGDWVMVCRFHYHVSEMIDWDDISKKYNGRIINGNMYDDMAEYLACTDILLTDASSSMFDYIITNRPCFLFFPDLDNYRNRERGFYLPIEKLPFPTAENFETLINNIIQFDEKKYNEMIQSLKNKLGYFEDGHASKRVIEYIMNDLKK